MAKTTTKKSKPVVEEKIIERKVKFNLSKDKSFTTTGKENKPLENCTTVDNIKDYKKKYYQEQK